MAAGPSIGTASERVQRTCALSDPVSRLRFVSASRAEALERLGVFRVRDLLLPVPHRYLDFSRVSKIAFADVGQDATVVGRVDKEDRRLVLTSLPGDTRVFIDGVHTTLGSVFVDKGLEFFLGKVTALTGFPVDYYGVVSIPSMEAIIDQLGRRI